jgi:DNA-binding GntR family transcriptional regulator
VHRGWNRLTALRGSTFSFVPERASESVAEHEELLKLIESGAPVAEIELAARRHRSATLDAYLASTGTHPNFPTL